MPHRHFLRRIIPALLASLQCLVGNAAVAQLYLSEFMAANQSSLLDEDGDASDWIEIANSSDAPVSLAGWTLTDDAQLPSKWTFPAVTVPARGYVVVFASGKNRTAAPPFHTNFRLAAEGEYLALRAPGAPQPSTAFDPAYPAQDDDLSFGIPSQDASEDRLAGRPVQILVPARSDDLAADWTLPAFAPSAAWSQQNGFGLGFDNVPASTGSGTNLARRGTATQSTTAFGGVPEAAIDGDLDNYTHTASADNASSWSLDLGAEVEISRIVLRNRTSCCQSRLRDLTVTLLTADGSTIWTSPLLNPENQLDGPEAITLDLLDLADGPVAARVLKVTRTPDPDLSGSGGMGNADEDSVLSLGEVEVYGVESLSYASWIRTDLSSAMKDRQTSAFVRASFVLEAAETVSALALELRYDDGVIVHLNGTPIATLNAPTSPAWNASALSERAKSNGVETVAFDLLGHPALRLDGTNLIAFQVVNASTSDPDLLLDARVVATATRTGARRVAYLNRPTPGSANDAGWNLGRVADTTFSVKRGFFTNPFDLAISTLTPGAEIRYTLDGSTPTETSGTIYTAPLRLTATTVVRAAAFKRDYRPTNVDTHSYLFLDQVTRQPAAPAGFPASWSGVTADYAMDARITGATAFRSAFPATLKSLPTLALSLPVDDLFSASRGIYANPERNGIAWERATSVEWIDPDGSTRFQVDAGLRIQGGYFRQRGATQKHSLRLLFKDQYGPGKLRTDLFEEFGAAEEFDTLVLRAGANDGYSWDAARDTEQFLRDEFGRRIFLAMGQPSVRGRFVHLYLNGLYWGLYNLTERPAEDFSATYLGGRPEDWDAINSGEVKNGDLNAWNALIAAARTATNTARFLRLQGLAPDGSRDTNAPALLDATNYIDYMVANLWGGNWDWPNKNFWFGRERNGLAGGFKFYLWDFENTMGNNRDRSPLEMVAPRPDVAASWVGEPHERLKRNPEYRLAFADRVQRHFFGQGVLTPDTLVARYRALASSVEGAIPAESARWGDDHHSTPQDPTDWTRERDWLLNTYLPQRSAIVLRQFKAAGLYPTLDAPLFTPQGPAVPAATPLLITTKGAEVIYTTDGSDPRLPGGDIHPNALRVTFDNAVPEVPATLVASGQSWRYLDGGAAAPANWRSPAFNDTSWKAGPSPLGYGDGDEATVVTAADTDPNTAGVQRNATTYFRTSFDVSHPAAYTALRAALTYDDAGAVYLNGTEILRTPNLPVTATGSTYATSASSDNAVLTQDPLPISLLVAGRNTLAVEIHQSDPGSSDISFDFELTGTPAGSDVLNQTPPIALHGPTLIKARARTGTTWSALSEQAFLPGVSDALTNLFITEICAQPAEPTLERAISTDRDDFEFIELTNLGDAPLDLSGVRLSGAIRIVFPPNTVLAARASAAIASHAEAFRVRYGTRVTLLGQYEDHLDASGEELHLQRADGSTLQRFTYRTSSPWPTPDTSLVLRRPDLRPDPSFPGNWRSSRFVLGSPGASDSLPFTGNPGADLDGNGRPDLVDYAFGNLGPATTLQLGTGQVILAYSWIPAAEDVTVLVEQSASVMGPWFPAAVESAPGDRLGLPERHERRRLTLALPETPEVPWFLRLIVTARP